MRRLKHPYIQTLALLTLFIVLTGCRSQRIPDLGEIYSDAVMNYASDQNPVIVIPGVLGSRLVQPSDGTVIWGAFDRTAADVLTPEGARLGALPMQKGKALAELTDTVIPDGALRELKLNLFGLPVQLDAYKNILTMLGVGGYRDYDIKYAKGLMYDEAHYTCFQFDYDWRRSNVENAKKLGELIEERTAIIEADRREKGDLRPIKFNIVAHSMGGLIGRYYLRYGKEALPTDGSLPELTWAGAKHVNSLILIGTPNAGSIETMDKLKNGLNIWPIVSYPPAVLSTFPALYELLPRPRHGTLVDADDPNTFIDFMKPAFWQDMQWGLASPDESKTLSWLLPDVASEEERLAIALDHQKKCLENATQFHAALDLKAHPPSNIQIKLIAGDAKPTWFAYQLDRSSGKLKQHTKRPGDGIVTRTSALMDERMGSNWRAGLASPIDWDHVMFLFEDHIGLTKSPMFIDNILFQLLEQHTNDEHANHRKQSSAH